MRFRLLIVVLMLFCLCGCGKKDIVTKTQKGVISDYLSDDIYVEENGKLVPYIIADNDYDGNTLLLRKYLLKEKKRMNEYYALYENSEIDKYLETQFYNRFPDNVKDKIITTDVEAVGDDYYATVENTEWFGDKYFKTTDNSVLKRKVFLLSLYEVSSTMYKDMSMVMEGKKQIQYFNDPSHILAQKEDDLKGKYAWWLRSVDTGYSSCFYVIDGEGTLGSTNAFERFGIRPAFCVGKDEKVKTSEDGSGRLIFDD